MLEAALWGLLGGSSLIVGAAIGLAACPGRRTIALIMGFGAGVLVSAVAFDLTAEALELGGADAAALGLATGALAFFAGDTAISRRGGRAHHTPIGKPGDDGESSPAHPAAPGREAEEAAGNDSESAPAAIALGTLLDGVPESAAIGITLLEGGGVSASFVVAVFLSNLPESLSAAAEFDRAGRSRRWILALWTSIAVIAALSAGLGYELLGDASDDLTAAVGAFAGGAILCMLANTLIPQAYRLAGSGHRLVGLVTVLGFALAALLSAA